MSRTMIRAVALAAGASIGSVAPVAAQDAPMSFFVTSQNPGSGGDLGGLEGADAHCAALAQAAGAPGGDWRAYLSTGEVDARDRIGSGPWANAIGETVAQDVDALHDGADGLTKETALDETGAVVNGQRRRAQPPRHPDRLGARRAALGRGLRQLDERRRGLGPRGTSRPHGRRRRPDLLELRPRDGGLQPGGPALDGRRRALLLLQR